jgi:hypothetical protein
MQSFISTCPKCGYLRQPSDSAPEFECPKCGVIYAKYLATLQGRPPELSSSPKSTTESMSKDSPSNNQAEEFSIDSREKWARLFQSHLTRWRYLYAPCLIGALIVILGICFTDYGNLRYRYWGYIGAIESLNFDGAYSYLSPSTRRMMPLAAWRLHYESSTDMRNKETFKSVSFSADGRSARVISIVALDGKDVRPNYQTWIKEGGSWSRGFIEDQPIAVKEINRKFDNKQNALSRSKVYSLNTSWDISEHDLGSIMASPKTSIVMLNDGSVPISQLAVKVEYYDKQNSVVIAEAQADVVSSTDQPLPPNARSKTLFLNSSAGFVMQTDAASALTMKRIAERVERRLFFRLANTDLWSPLPTEHLSEK